MNIEEWFELSPNNHMPNGKNWVKQSSESDQFVANWAREVLVSGVSKIWAFV
jgi:hypothetical protein